MSCWEKYVNQMTRELKGGESKTRFHKIWRVCKAQLGVRSVSRNDAKDTAETWGRDEDHVSCHREHFPQTEHLHVFLQCRCSFTSANFLGIEALCTCLTWEVLERGRIAIPQITLQ